MPRVYTKSGSVEKYEPGLFHSVCYNFGNTKGGIITISDIDSDGNYTIIPNKGFEIVGYKSPYSECNWLASIYGEVKSNTNPIDSANWIKCMPYFVGTRKVTDTDNKKYVNISLFATHGVITSDGLWIWCVWGGSNIAKESVSLIITGTYQVTKANANIPDSQKKSFTLNINVVAGKTSNYSFQNSTDAFYVGAQSQYSDVDIVSATMTPSSISNSDGIYTLSF